MKIFYVPRRIDLLGNERANLAGEFPASTLFTMNSAMKNFNIENIIKILEKTQRQN